MKKSRQANIDEWLTGDYKRRRIMSDGTNYRYLGHRSVVAKLKGHHAGRSTLVRTVRARPAAPFYRQLSLGQTQMCTVSSEMFMRCRGSTPNSAVLLTQTCGKFDLHAFVPRAESGNFVHTEYDLELALNSSTALPSTLADTSSQLVGWTTPVQTMRAIPRRSWDMGFCSQYRDMISYAYGMFGSAAACIEGFSFNDTSESGSPNVFGAGAIAYPRLFDNTNTSTTDEGFAGTNEGAAMDQGSSIYTAGASVEAPASNRLKTLLRMKDLEERVPLYVKSEELEFEFYNPTEYKQYITLYECILKQDIKLMMKTIGTTAVTFAAIPDPIALWSDYIHTTHEFQQATTVLNASVNAQEGGDGSGFTHIHLDTQPAAATTVSDVHRSPFTPGMKPMGRYLDRWYKIVPHKVVLEAGCRKTLRFIVYHEGCPTFNEVGNLYAKAYKSRTFMLRVEGERVIGKAGDQGTYGTMNLFNATAVADVLVTTRRTNKFGRYRDQPKSLQFRQRLLQRTDLAATYQVDSETGDFEGTAVTGAAATTAP